MNQINNDILTEFGLFPNMAIRINNDLTKVTKIENQKDGILMECENGEYVYIFQENGGYTITDKTGEELEFESINKMPFYEIPDSENEENNEENDD